MTPPDRAITLMGVVGAGLLLLNAWLAPKPPPASYDYRGPYMFSPAAWQRQQSAVDAALPPGYLDGYCAPKGHCYILGQDGAYTPAPDAYVAAWGGEPADTIDAMQTEIVEHGFEPYQVQTVGAYEVVWLRRPKPAR